MLFQKIRAFFVAIHPILLSHHPLCEPFAHDHTFSIGKSKFCIGCFIGIPSAIVMMIIGELTGLFHQLPMEQLWLVGLCCSSVTLFSFFPFADRVQFKILSKILLGAGFAFGSAAIWALSWHSSIKIMIELLYFQVALILVQLVRGIKMNRICNACPYKVDWDHCPGWGPMVQRYHDGITEKIPLPVFQIFKK